MTADVPAWRRRSTEENEAPRERRRSVRFYLPFSLSSFRFSFSSDRLLLPFVLSIPASARLLLQTMKPPPLRRDTLEKEERCRVLGIGDEKGGGRARGDKDRIIVDMHAAKNQLSPPSPSLPFSSVSVCRKERITRSFDLLMSVVRSFLLSLIPA